MLIKYKEEEKLKPIKKLEPGQVFKHGSSIYMVTTFIRPMKSDQIPCAQLENGITYLYNRDLLVTPVNAKLEISES